MKKYIVSEHNGLTGLLELRDDQSYHGDIIWDESKDGPIPKEFKGKERYLKRQGKDLVEDTAVKIISDKKDIEKTNAVLDNNAKKIKLANYDGNDAGAGAVLLDLLKILGLHS